jgi:hypothetical protein
VQFKETKKKLKKKQEKLQGNFRHFHSSHIFLHKKKKEFTEEIKEIF